jgi:hypothetical protein
MGRAAKLKKARKLNATWTKKGKAINLQVDASIEPDFFDPSHGLDPEMGRIAVETAEGCYPGLVSSIHNRIDREQQSRLHARRIVAAGDLNVARDPRLSTLIELLKMSLDDLRLNPERAPFSDNLEKTRSLGQKAHDDGGFNLMYTFADLVPLYDQSELDYCWDGIGDWKA